MQTALKLQGVEKSFGEQKAVTALELTVPSGETCGLIGPSGAGKTTSIRLIMSILFPDAGTVEVLGQASALQAKDRIGYLPEERGVYRKMKVWAFLKYLAGLKGMPEAKSQPRAKELLAALGLDDILQKRCEDLSKGMLQRVQFVGSILHQPELLILDEPFSGLDPVSVRALKGVISAERRRGTTILFSTHVMAQAEELCDRVVMIHKGRKVLDEPMASLRRRYDPTRVLFEPLDANASLAVLRDVPGVVSLQQRDGEAELSLAKGTDPAAVIREAAARVVPARIEIARITLEDVFVGIVRGQSGAESEAALRQHLQGLSGEKA
ncbi:MAG: ATP-binding cassette domain-containing protein [Proteobacteria bacterium]|nr:ATP-binding cassette domain-containing protein [Pseudomonadota bacterium]MBK7116731.1 ATP-binding cassette domain-containing protein [Pseudomonadota bacterium]MBK9251110.1 ATP-binding cassette domain-containing protein [Pseudomonadota bacterium]MCC6632557.1 ATP-binding cassette domain-containing protein [Gammaproteobacteria bacterium]